MGGKSGDEGAGGVRDNEEVGPLTGKEGKAAGTEDGILYRVVGSRGRAVGAAAVGLAAAPSAGRQEAARALGPLRSARPEELQGSLRLVCACCASRAVPP